MIFGGVSVTPFATPPPPMVLSGCQCDTRCQPAWFLCGVRVTPFATPTRSAAGFEWCKCYKKVKAITNPKPSATRMEPDPTIPVKTWPVSWMVVGSELVSIAGRCRTCSRIRMIIKILLCTTMQDIMHKVRSGCFPSTNPKLGMVIYLSTHSIFSPSSMGGTELICRGWYVSKNEGSGNT